ncbi:PspC domain-containing protein [Salinispira pacifica]
MNTQTEASFYSPNQDCLRASRNDIVRRLLRRESLFWRGSTGVNDDAQVDNHERAQLRPDRRLQAIAHEICLVAGERYVADFPPLRDGRALLVTTYRLVQYRDNVPDDRLLIPLSALRGLRHMGRTICFELSDGRRLCCSSGSRRSTERGIGAVDAAIGQRRWQSLDPISRGLLLLTRSGLRRDLGFDVPPPIPLVPAVRRGRFQLGHERKSRVLGVCAGIAAYRCIRPERLRILFLLTTPLFGLGIAAYLLLALVMGVNAWRSGSPHRRYEDADISGCPTINI